MARRALLMLALLALVPQGAMAAAAWRTHPGSETAGGAQSVINRGERLYLYTDDAGPTTVMLDLSRCGSGLDLFYDSNVGGASAAPANTAALAWCPAPTYDANVCNGLFFDVDGGGVDTNLMTGDASGGTAQLWGIRTRYLAVTLTVGSGAVQMTGDCW